MSTRKYHLNNQIATYALIGIGAVLIVASAIYASSFLVISGLALIFWALIIQYLMPAKHVPITFLNASAKSTTENIERVLSEFNLTEKAVYLPPKNLANINSGLIFIPMVLKTDLPTSEEKTEKLSADPKKGIFLTPPGLAFSQLIEQEYHASLIGTDFKTLKSSLPTLFIQNLGLAETFKIEQTENQVTIEITNCLLNDICQESANQPKTHSQVGCLLSSALACILAKTIGKPITIQNETNDAETKTTTIIYNIEE